MSYQTLKIKENNDVEKLNEYPNNSLIFRIGYRSNMYSYFTEKDKKIIINYKNKKRILIFLPPRPNR